MYSISLPHAQPPPLPVMQHLQQQQQQQQAPTAGVSASAGSASVVLPMPWVPSDAAAAAVCPPPPSPQQQQQYLSQLPPAALFPVVVGSAGSGGTGPLTQSMASPMPHYLPYSQFPLSPPPLQPAPQPLFTPPSQSVQYVVSQQQSLSPVVFAPPQPSPTTTAASAPAPMNTAVGLATGLPPQYAYLAHPPATSGAGPIFINSPPFSTALDPGTAAATTTAPLLSVTSLPLSDGNSWYIPATTLSSGVKVAWPPSSSSSSHGRGATPLSSTPPAAASATPAPPKKGVVPKSLRHSTNGIGLEMGGIYQGVIKRYNHSRGFGFIQSDQGVDIFFHSSGISSSCATFDVGQRVEFRVSPDLDHVQAVEVRVVSSLSR